MYVNLIVSDFLDFFWWIYRAWTRNWSCDFFRRMKRIWWVIFHYIIILMEKRIVRRFLNVMVREEKGMKPILLKCGLALALTFAGFLYSHFRTRRIKPSPANSSIGHHSGLFLNFLWSTRIVTRHIDTSNNLIK